MNIEADRFGGAISRRQFWKKVWPAVFTLTGMLFLGCAASKPRQGGEFNDLERAVFVGELEGDIPLRYFCGGPPVPKHGVSETFCMEGDMVLYGKTVDVDGTSDEEWTIAGAQEYQRVVRKPGKEPIRLVRAMCSNWEYRRESDEVTPPEGPNEFHGVSVGSSDGFRCANRQSTEGAQIRECFLGGNALIFRYTRWPDGKSVRSWFVEGGPEYLRMIEGPGGRPEKELRRGICGRWSGPETPADVSPPGGRATCDCSPP